MKNKIIFTLIIILINVLSICRTSYGYPRRVPMKEYRAITKNEYPVAQLSQPIREKLLELYSDIFNKSNSYLSYQYKNKEERQLLLQAIFTLEASYFYYEHMSYSEGKNASDETGVIYINASKARLTYNRNKQLRQEILKITDELKITDWTSERQAVKKINRYICENYDYDYNKKNRTAYNMVKYKTGVCSAYTELFRILCNYYGIQVEDVMGNDGEHEWSRVKIYGKWKYTDVSWNDALEKNKYLNQSKKAFYKDKKHKEYYIQHFQPAKSIIWLDQ